MKQLENGLILSHTYGILEYNSSNYIFPTYLSHQFCEKCGKTGKLIDSIIKRDCECVPISFSTITYEDKKSIRNLSKEELELKKRERLLNETAP